MIVQAGDTAIFLGHFTESKLGKTGLTVTYNIYRNGAVSPVASGTAVEVAQGLYRATFLTTVTGDYVCMFATATTTVDQREIPALNLALTWAGLVDAAVSSRSTLTAPNVWEHANRTLTSYGTLVADIWSNATRTLTMTAAAIIASITGSSDIERKRGDTFAISLTIGSLVGYASVWITVTADPDSPDADARFQIKKNASLVGDGLLYLNGVAATANLGSITISSEATGAIIINLDETASAQLVPGTYQYDIQTLISGIVTTVAEGNFVVTEDKTRATS